MSQLLALLAFAVVACLALSWPADRDGSDISVIAAHDGFLRPKENWILKDDTCMGLLNLRGRIEYAKERASGSLSQPEVDEFFRESLCANTKFGSRFAIEILKNGQLIREVSRKQGFGNF